MEDDRQDKKQKIGRNIMSNIIKSFIKHLNSEEFMKTDFESLKKAH